MVAGEVIFQIYLPKTVSACLPGDKPESTAKNSLPKMCNIEQWQTMRMTSTVFGIIILFKAFLSTVKK